MPLYMDTHRNVADLTAEAVAGAHQADLATQKKYGVEYKQYWYNEETGAVYCLVEAPNAEAAAAVHKEAHGLVADDIVGFTKVTEAQRMPGWGRPQRRPQPGWKSGDSLDAR